MAKINILKMKCCTMLICLVFAFSVNAQNLPYLNASPGNANQSVTDKDTNLYMFHGTQLEKVNKNLLPIWVNNYNNIHFSNLLLSKTGCIFFLAQNKIGKINANGNLDWVNTLTAIGSGSQAINNLNLKQVFLDRNNHLIITALGQGTATASAKRIFLKIDTLGNLIQTRLFQSVNNTSIVDDNFNIINDSLGNYKFYADDVSLAGRVGYVFNYSETLDAITSKKELDYFDTYNSNPYGQPVYFYKSKFGSNFYIATQSKNNFSIGFVKLKKYNTTKGLISDFGIGTWGLDSYFDGFNEDEKGNVLLLARTINTPGFDRGCELLDSNCIRLNGVKIFTHQPFSSITNNIHVIHNTNYFFDAVGSLFPINPLTVANITASLSCYSTMPVGSSASCNTTSSCFAGTMTSSISIANPSFVTITAFSSTVTAISNFSTIQNYCSVITDIKSDVMQNSGITFYPNPFTTKIQVTNSKLNLLKLEIYNAQGILITQKECQKKINEIDLFELPSGIYFIKTYFEDKMLIHKLIKE